MVCADVCGPSESDWVQRWCAHGRYVCLFVPLLVELPNQSTDERTRRHKKQVLKKRRQQGVCQRVCKQVITADDVQSERHVFCRLVVPVVHAFVALVQHNVGCLVKALQHALLCVCVCARRDESQFTCVCSRRTWWLCVSIRVCKPPSHVRRWSRPKPALLYPPASSHVSLLCPYVCVCALQTFKVRLDEKVCHSVSSRARTLNDRNNEQKNEAKKKGTGTTFQTTCIETLNNWFCLFSLVGRARCL